jgi:hypothetical protein
MERWMPAVVTTLLVGAALVFAPPALGQDRGRSGLPPGSGNPFTTLDSSTATATGAETLAVYDATGRRVGPLVGIEDLTIALVALDAAGHRLVLRAAASRLFGTQVWYEAADCVGPPLLGASFMDAASAPVFSLAGVAGPGQTVYVADHTSGPEWVPARSTRNLDGSCMTFTFGFNTFVLPGLPVVDLDESFTAPYSVR